MSETVLTSHVAMGPILFVALAGSMHHSMRASCRLSSKNLPGTAVLQQLAARASAHAHREGWLVQSPLQSQ